MFLELGKKDAVSTNRFGRSCGHGTMQGHSHTRVFALKYSDTRLRVSYQADPQDSRRVYIYVEQVS
jgi:hypothetical protein